MMRIFFAKLVAAASLTVSAQAALVDQAELPKLAAQAQKNGAVAVMVHLVPTTIDQLGNDLKGVKADVARRKSLLLAELGTRAWDGGRWDNEIGQIGLQVTAAGLNILQSSANAVSFFPDRPWNSRTQLSGLDGSHAEIDRLLDSQGFLDAVVTLNVEGLAFDTLKDGSVSLQTNAQTIEEGRSKAHLLLDGLTEFQLPGKIAALAAVGSLTAPTLTLRLTREGVLKLAESDLVRSLKPVGFRDVRPLSIGPDVVEAAQRDGAAQVIITIRTPMLGGNLSKASFTAQTQAHKRALDSVLTAASVGNPLQDLSTLGAMAGRLTYAQLQALKISNDARLLAIELNRPVASPSLTNSTLLMNMPAAWGNTSFRGAGQNIIVLDTGVQSNHQFFQDGVGVSRVFFEGCFGTNAPPFASVCPIFQQDPNGDSPGGLAGSAKPCGGDLTLSSSCHHGTHVAGIAAGRASSSLPWVPPITPPPVLPAQFQGVAPEARIAAFQVFSYTSAGAASVFAEDLALVMQQLVNIMTPGTSNNPFVVNMSFGSQAFTAPCPDYSQAQNPVVQAVTTAIEMLFNLGVPVVAATGNERLSGAIGWPACVPKVIKVSSVLNNSAGITRSPQANLANPSAFPGEQFWLAPGGGGGIGVRSSAPSNTTTATTFDEGTSFAAPHITGLYAALKGLAPTNTVSFISGWIDANASVPVTTNVVCTGSTTNLCPTTFKRPRWP